MRIGTDNARRQDSSDGSNVAVLLHDGRMTRRTLLGAAVLAPMVAMGKGAPPPDGSLREFTRDDLLADSRIPQMRKAYREWGLPIKTPVDSLMNTVRTNATADGMTGIFIKFRGDRREEHIGVTGMYNVVDAIGVRLVDPTTENIVDSLKRVGHVYPLEIEVVARRAADLHVHEASPLLLSTAKATGNVGLLRAYAQIEGPQAEPELTKILKFHALAQARIAAADELARLGVTKPIEEALAAERDDAVRQSLQRTLLR